jgi:DNA polymerase (family X)
VPPSNKEIVNLLEEIALLLELTGESPFKSRAYTNVARRIEQFEGSVAELAQEQRLREIEGVGDALEQKIAEYVKTGKLEYHENLRAKFPDALFELFAIPGLGPKRIKHVYEDLGVKSLAELEKACDEGKLAELPGFGEKMQERVREGIAFARQQSGQHLFHKAYSEAKRIVAYLTEFAPLQRIDVAGSLRRRKELVKDLDLIASSKDPVAVMKYFVEDAEVARVTGHGDTKSSVVLKSGIAADLRVVSDKQFPYALLHFTGSKEHNVVMRQRAKDRGWKLNEYGLFDGEKLLPCKEEKDIHKKLGLPYIPPEIREDMGEFELEKTPSLVTMDDILGMIHCHSTWSDGRASVAAMAEAAQERGYHYIVMTDHSQSAAYAGGLTPKRVAEQQAEIDALNKKLKNFRVLKGIESDIRADGSLDYSDKVLSAFEVVIASVHSGIEMSKAQATKRIVKAVENPHTTILGHPTGRLLLQRKGYELDYDKVFDACAANNVAIEINGNCHRLDLDWRYVRQARDKGVMLSIGPDAHDVEGLNDMQYGVGIARKGWLAPEHVVNCLTLKEFLAWTRK